MGMPRPQKAAAAGKARPNQKEQAGRYRSRWGKLA
jgi:hypothetical protein